MVDTRSNWEFWVKRRGLANRLAELGGLNGRLADPRLEIGSLWNNISYV